MMSEPTTSATTSPDAAFVDRRDYTGPINTRPMGERRQFSNSHDGLSADAHELAVAIDEYKVRHRRRFITYEEMLNVIHQLGFVRVHEPS